MNQLAKKPDSENDLSTITINDGGVLKVIDLHTGEVVAANNLNLANHNKYHYTLPLASHICDLIREGHSFVSISKMPNMPPYSAIMRWRHLHPDFAEAIKRAKQDRAELYHDRVIEEADNIATEEDAKIAKPKIDAYKWAAEKNNPEEYGKAKPEKDHGGITFVINTGIPAEQPFTIEAQYGTTESEDSDARGSEDGDGEGAD